MSGIDTGFDNTPECNCNADCLIVAPEDVELEKAFREKYPNAIV